MHAARDRLALPVERAAFGSEGVIWTAFFVAHAFAALLMDQNRQLSTLHAAVTVGVGLWWALSGNRPERVAYVAAYIVGSEVLWRMTAAQIFWEFGKYACAAIMLVMMLRSHSLRGPVLPFFYILLLLPAAALTFGAEDFIDARKDISFNLSGPLLLMVAAWFFSGLSLSRKHVLTLFLLIMAPISGVSMISFAGVITAGNIVFTNESNFVTSGGFGPNQVSGMLALGALLAFLIAAGQYTGKRVRTTMLLLTLLWGAQSALTFSREGLYAATAGVAVAVFVLVRDPAARARLVPVVLASFLAVNYLLLPALDVYTSGEISTRFADIATTNRDALIREDLRVWEENFAFGVGPGMAKLERNAASTDPIAAHTEFTRLLSEHGLLGLVAMSILFVTCVQNLRRIWGTHGMAVVPALLVWAIVFMASAAMRLAAPTFLFGLAAANFVPDDAGDDSAPIVGPAPTDALPALISPHRV